MFMQRQRAATRRLAVGTLALTVAGGAGAADGLRVRAGDVPGERNATGASVGVAFDSRNWLDWLGADDQRYELGLLVLPRVQEGEALYGLHFGLAWRFHADWLPPRTFLEAGIGVAWLDAQFVGDRGLGSHAHFMQHALLGFRPERESPWHVGVRLRHTSNAGLAQPNPGFELLQIEFGVPLGAD